MCNRGRLKSRWGADADEFNPHRWLDGTVNRGDAVGVGPYASLYVEATNGSIHVLADSQAHRQFELLGRSSHMSRVGTFSSPRPEIGG